MKRQILFSHQHDFRCKAQINRDLLASMEINGIFFFKKNLSVICPASE